MVDLVANVGSDRVSSFFNPYGESFEVLDVLGTFPQLASATNRRLRIEITPESMDLQFWAFVAVTNNETQEVTTFTPQ